MESCDYNHIHLFGNHPDIPTPKQFDFFKGLKSDLEIALSDFNFPWVEKAIETKFVQKTNSFDQNDRLDVDDLIIFIDSYRWKDIAKQDAWLTIEQREELKGSIRECNVSRYSSIYDLLDQPDFIWFPFEVKHALIANFSSLIYTNDDIIYYLKTIIWDYLFPNYYDIDRLNLIESEVGNILQNSKESQGWYELSKLVLCLKSTCPGIDMFEISKVCTSSHYQYKLHYRNPYTLGFKRFIEQDI